MNPLVSFYFFLYILRMIVNKNTTRSTALSSTAKEMQLKKKIAGSCSEEPPMFVGDPLHTDNYSYVQLTQVC